MAHSVLIKIGQHAHMKALYENGEVYFGPLASHRTMEGDPQRFDPHEGVIGIKQFTSGVIEMQDHATGENQRVATITEATARWRSDKTDLLKVHCLYHCRVENGRNVFLHEQMEMEALRQFGDSAVVIYEARQYLNQVEEACRIKGMQMWRGAIEYVDTMSFDGPLGAFRKDIRYKHQSEYRLVAKGRKVAGPLKLRIGGLEHCALFMNISDFEQVNLDWPEESDAQLSI